MIAVIFEAVPTEAAEAEYFDRASRLRSSLEEAEGFVSVERFRSLSNPRKILSLSFWQDESALAYWRNLPEHREAQTAGRDHVFENYRLRVGVVERDYGLHSREEAPPDSRSVHTAPTDGT